MSMHIRDPQISGPTQQLGNGLPSVAGGIGEATAAGSTNADAASINNGYAVVSGADGTKGVILPAGVKGNYVTVKNAGGSALKVYPPAGAAINGLTATTGAISLAANTVARFVFASATQIYTEPLLPS